MSTKTLFTIGYEKATPDTLAKALRDAGVRTLIDVRAVAASRRAGFAKKALAARLERAGIAYLHLRDLGTPKAGRQAARAGRTAEMRRIYEAHLEEPAAQAQLAQAGDIAGEHKSALLCYEAEAACCHRRIVAERLSSALGFSVEDL